MRQGERINQLLNLGAAKAYYFHGGNWYHRLKEFPGVLIDINGYVSFANEAEYRMTPGLDISTTNDNQTHVPEGLSSLLGYRSFTDVEQMLIRQETPIPASQIAAPTDEKALRKKREVNALVRNQKHVQAIKSLYKNRCQLCGERIQVRPKKFYSEVHHIKPLGYLHDGADVQGNMLCVCPNHHTMLDFFSIRLDVRAFLLNKHPISTEYVNYHNQRVEQFNSTKVNYSNEP